MTAARKVGNIRQCNQLAIGICRAAFAPLLVNDDYLILKQLNCSANISFEPSIDSKKANPFNSIMLKILVYGNYLV